MQRNREIQAETNAQAIGDVIRAILEHQNKTADTRRNEDNQRLWRIALVTIIGSGITSAIGRGAGQLSFEIKKRFQPKKNSSVRNAN